MFWGFFLAVNVFLGFGGSWKYVFQVGCCFPRFLGGMFFWSECFLVSLL